MVPTSQVRLHVSEHKFLIMVNPLFHYPAVTASTSNTIRLRNPQTTWRRETLKGGLKMDWEKMSLYELRTTTSQERQWKIWQWTCWTCTENTVRPTYSSLVFTPLWCLPSPKATKNTCGFWLRSWDRRNLSKQNFVIRTRSNTQLTWHLDTFPPTARGPHGRHWADVPLIPS